MRSVITRSIAILALVVTFFPAGQPAIQQTDGQALPGSALALELPLVAGYAVSADIGRDQPVYHFSPEGVAAAGGLTVAATGDGILLRLAETSAPAALSNTSGHRDSSSRIGEGEPPQGGPGGVTLTLAQVGDVDAAPISGTTFAANRLERDRGAVTEWLVAGPLGVQQAWEVAKRPASGLALTLAVTGAEASGEGVVALGAFSYGGLFVFDASGRELPATMQGDGDRIHIDVDDAGAVYPVTIDPLAQAAKLTASDGAASDNFGRSAAMSADGATVAFGAFGDDASRGSVYVYLRPVNGWATTATFAAKLTASDALPGNLLGFSVAVSADGATLAAGAYGKDAGRGAVYVFQRPAGGWTTGTETAILTASDRVGGDFFGFSLALSADGSTLAVGTPLANAPADDQGAVYLYERPGGGWATSSTFAAKLTASDGAISDQLGSATALSADGATVATGAPNAAGVKGAAYIFLRPGGGWATTAAFTAKLTASDGAVPDAFGSSIALAGDGATVAIGAPLANAPAIDQGAVYVFQRPGGGWVTTSAFTAKLGASDGNTGDFLGASVALTPDGSALAAGANGKSSNTGTAYFYQRPGATWATTSTFAAKLTASDGATSDNFGQAIALSADGGAVAAGAPGDDSARGGAYVFTQPIVASILPAAARPGDQVIISGLNFNGVSGVQFGGVAATSVVTSGSRISATLGAGGAGLVSIAAPGGPVTVTGFTFLPGSTTTALGSLTPAPGLVGSPVTISYTVASALGPPAGTVTVTASTGESCTGSPAAGACAIPFATAGARTVSAAYGGSAAFLASSSGSAAVLVLDPQPTGLSAGAGTPTILGNPTLFAATLAGGVGVAFSWAFGDGGVGSGPVVSHTYTAAGVYTATATASNGAGALNQTVQVVVVGPPTVQNIQVGNVITNGLTVQLDANPQGGETRVLIDYRLAGAGPPADGSTTIVGPLLPAGQFGAQSVSMSITGLTPGTAYVVRTRLVNVAGTATSAEQSVTTTAGPPAPSAGIVYLPFTTKAG
jgi:hypothetical protein